MSTELSNGVIIPEEYSDDWYDEMSINLRKLNDVITAASDNATEIQRIDTDKANSADLATVATSGSYTDLNNKPSIPTKTSDLTNDSNFVDTSNSAVASGITSAKVTSYDAHIADTDIHVTTADKTKWNNGVSQAYVFRYSGTAVVPNSTIAYSTIDNTDNIKSGDKILDVDGKLFEITAVDTTNQTVTVGTALIDLAVDANVMHLTGDETSTGKKSFVDNIIAKKIVSNVSQLQINAKTNADSVAMIGGDSASDGGGVWVYGKNTSNKSMVTLQVYDTDNSSYHAVRLNMDGSLTPTVSNNGLGSSSFKWVSFNGLNPGSLGMPDLDNGVDIRGYITDLTGASGVNSYTPPANGWVAVGLRGDFIEMYVPNFVFGSSFNKVDSGVVQGFMPVIANKTMRFAVKGTQIMWAKFYPCQGNV